MLNPNLPDASAHYAWFLETRGMTDDARQLMQRARQLDPLNPLWAAWAGWLALESDDTAALAAARSALELNAAHPHALYVAARAAVLLGRAAETAPWIAQLEQIPPFRWGAAHVHALLGNEQESKRILTALEAEPDAMNAFGLALGYAQLGDTIQAMDWLTEAHRLRFSWMPWIHRPNVFVPLTGEPRYDALLRTLNLPDPTTSGSSVSQR